MRHRRPCGLTLIELMIALAAGLLVVVSANALLRTARQVYVEIDDRAQVQETGRMILSHLRMALSQANHLPWESLLQSTRPVLRDAALHGLDDRRDARALDPATGGFDAGTRRGVNQSDMLMIGFFGGPGAGGGNGGGRIASCASGAIGTAPDDGLVGSQARRTWVIYYVGQTGTAQPELRCHYRHGNGRTGDDAIASGVESLQVLYGVDSDTTAGADRWLNASQMTDTLWSRVRLVRIALLVRGSHVDNRDNAREFVLLGPGAQAVSIAGQRLPPRMRAVFETTVLLRNPVPQRHASRQATGEPPP